MPDPIFPEPIRPMYDSDESHAAAWLRWAAATPGGWRARLADAEARGGGVVPDHVPPQWTAEPPAPAAPRQGTELVRYVQAQSPCCRTTVVVDPLVAAGGRGLCSTCGTVLDYVGPWWVPRPPGATG